MNYITIIIGLLFISYAIYVLTLRLKGKTENLKKLEPMKKFWGEKRGLVIHTVGYIIIPVLLGLIIVIAGIKGFKFI